MLQPTRIVCVATVIVGLSGCLSYTPEELEALSTFGERAQAGYDLGVEVNALHGTRYDMMPTTGSASFVGMGRILIDPDPNAFGDGLLAVGDAQLDADFAANTVTGAITNMEGIRGTNQDRAETFGIGGTITIGAARSQIGDDPLSATIEAPNDWQADYAGIMLTPLGDITVDGQLSGKFRGTRINNPATDFPIKAIAGTDTLGTAMNGTEALPLDIRIAGENP